MRAFLKSPPPRTTNPPRKIPHQRTPLRPRRLHRPPRTNRPPPPPPRPAAAPCPHRLTQPPPRGDPSLWHFDRNATRTPEECGQTTFYPDFAADPGISQRSPSRTTALTSPLGPVPQCRFPPDIAECAPFLLPPSSVSDSGLPPRAIPTPYSCLLTPVP